MEQYTAQWMGWNNTRQSGCGWNNPRQRADGTVTGLMDADGNIEAEADGTRNSGRMRMKQMENSMNVDGNRKYKRM